MQLTLKALTTNLIDDNWQPINTMKWRIKNNSLKAFYVIKPIVSVRHWSHQAETAEIGIFT